MLENTARSRSGTRETPQTDTQDRNDDLNQWARRTARQLFLKGEPMKKKKKKHKAKKQQEAKTCFNCALHEHGTRDIPTAEFCYREGIIEPAKIDATTCKFYKYKKQWTWTPQPGTAGAAAQREYLMYESGVDMYNYKDDYYGELY